MRRGVGGEVSRQARGVAAWRKALPSGSIRRWGRGGGKGRRGRLGRIRRPPVLTWVMHASGGFWEKAVMIDGGTAIGAPTPPTPLLACSAAQGLVQLYWAVGGWARLTPRRAAWSGCISPSRWPISWVAAASKSSASARAVVRASGGAGERWGRERWGCRPWRRGATIAGGGRGVGMWGVVGRAQHSQQGRKMWR